MEITVHDGMSDELNTKLRHSFCVPLLLKGNDAQKKVEILSNLICPPWPRGPDLGRDELDDFGFPVVEPTVALADILANSAGETPVKCAEVHADDRVRFAFHCEPIQPFDQLL